MIRSLVARHRPQVGLVLALLVASGVCTALVAVRVALTGHLGYVFLVKNLVLAWMPMLFALIALALASSPSRRNLVLATLPAAAWLVFFPNAPYLMTDLMLSVFCHPFANARTLAFSGLCAVSLASVYLVLYALAHVRPEPERAA